MKKVIIAAAVLGIGFAIWFLFNLKPEQPFNEVQLTENNIVVNVSSYPWMDTLVSVGLDELQIKEVTVTIMDLKESIKSNFVNQDLELKAAIVGSNDQYVIYVDTELSREEALRVLSHELVHLMQYHSGILVQTGSSIKWEGKNMDVERIPYQNRPWEAEAFQKEKDLAEKIGQKLY